MAESIYSVEVRLEELEKILRKYPKAIQDDIVLQTAKNMVGVASRDLTDQMLRKKKIMRTRHMRLNIEEDFPTRVGEPGKAGWSDRNVPYAKFVDQGTKPHIIRPKAAKSLRFFNRHNDEVFAKVVHHPGTKPRHLIRDAKITVEKKFAGEVAELVKRFKVD